MDNQSESARLYALTDDCADIGAVDAYNKAMEVFREVANRNRVAHDRYLAGEISWERRLIVKQEFDAADKAVDLAESCINKF